MITKINLPVNEESPLVFVVDPPWGNGFCHKQGLDILSTAPSVDHIINQVSELYGDKNIIFFIKLHEKFNEESVSKVRAHFSFSKVY